MNRSFSRVSAALLAASAFLAPGCSYSKVYRDGVWEITENGVTRYEGDPDKVAALMKRKQAEEQYEANHQAKLDAAPRRTSSEPVRVGIIAVGTGNTELDPLVPKYLEMLVAEFSNAPGFELADPRAVYSAAQTVSAATAHGSRLRDDQALPVPEFRGDNLKKMRYAGMQADVLVYVTVAPETKTGFVSGPGQGTGVIQATGVRFDTRFSSTFNFREHHAGEIGNSISDFSAAGLNREGKAKSGSISFKRDITKDRPAIKKLTDTIKRTTQSEILRTLPSLADVRPLDAERGDRSMLGPNGEPVTAEQIMEQLQQSFR